MGKYTGSIAELTPEQQVNTILFRLAEEMGYESKDGIITSDPDEILNSALKTINLHNNEYFYPNTEENN